MLPNNPSGCYYAIMEDSDEKKRDLVLKRMMETPPESSKELASRKRVDRYKEQAGTKSPNKTGNKGKK